jgi:hypothetical protein
MRYDLPSIFVTPDSVDNAKRLWDSWGMKSNIHIFCLLQICKIQDIIHLARIHRVLPELEDVSVLNSTFSPTFKPRGYSYMSHFAASRQFINDGSFVDRWYKYVLANEDQKDLSTYYFNHAVILLDSPYQTIDVVLEDLHDPMYAKYWIFDCLNHFASILGMNPPEYAYPQEELRKYKKVNLYKFFIYI